LYIKNKKKEKEMDKDTKRLKRWIQKKKVKEEDQKIDLLFVFCVIYVIYLIFSYPLLVFCCIIAWFLFKK
jgi:hypothetical protein